MEHAFTVTATEPAFPEWRHPILRHGHAAWDGVTIGHDVSIFDGDLFVGDVAVVQVSSDGRLTLAATWSADGFHLTEISLTSEDLRTETEPQQVVAELAVTHGPHAVDVLGRLTRSGAHPTFTEALAAVRTAHADPDTARTRQPRTEPHR